MGIISAEQLRTIFYRLLPRGPIWPTEQDAPANLDGLIRGLSVEPKRVIDRVQDLLLEFFPDTATETLERWEALAALLPDGLTVSERQLQLLTKLTATRPAHASDVQDIAANFGLITTVEQYFKGFRCGATNLGPVDGRSGIGSNCTHAWTVAYERGTLADIGTLAGPGETTVDALVDDPPYVGLQGRRITALIPFGGAALEWVGINDTSPVRVGLYLKSPSAGSTSAWVLLAGGSSQLVTLASDQWHHYTIDLDSVSAADDIVIRIFNNGGIVDVCGLSVHQPNAVFEAAVRDIAPTHTTPIFRPPGDGQLQ